MLSDIVHTYIEKEKYPMIIEKMKDAKCRRGIKAVQKSIMEKKDGIVILAADITPFDLVSHIPGLCSSAKIPLRYIQSRFDITTEKNKSVTCLFIPREILTETEKEKLL
ncbi:H/ACA ribonucleoprotein complex subunit 2 [Nematocida sp. AWRm80]|nr:H/ACA ribonucleoprotein complex subunit 2 [Nematocida sp. AWRm80]